MDDEWEDNNNVDIDVDETPRPEESQRSSQVSRGSRRSPLPSPLQFHYSIMSMQTSGSSMFAFNFNDVKYYLKYFISFLIQLS